MNKKQIFPKTVGQAVSVTDPTDSNVESLNDALTHMNNKVQVDTANGNMLKVKVGNDTYVLNNMVKLETPANPVIDSNVKYVVTGNASVSITCATSGATIYYRVGAKSDSGSSAAEGTGNYTALSGSSINLASGYANDKSNANVFYYVQAYAKKNGVLSGTTYAIVLISPKVATPSISADGDEYSTSRTVTITCATTGSTIHYEDRNSTASSSSNSYSQAFSLSATTKVHAMATKSGYADSAETSSSITVGTLPMYYGTVTTAPTSLTGIKAMTVLKQKTLPLKLSFTMSQSKACFAYPTSLGSLSHIIDANNFDLVDSFTKTTVGSYTVYTLTNAATGSDTFNFTK